jgi:hypothetical protein
MTSVRGEVALVDAAALSELRPVLALDGNMITTTLITVSSARRVVGLATLLLLAACSGPDSLSAPPRSSLPSVSPGTTAAPAVWRQVPFMLPTSVGSSAPMIDVGGRLVLTDNSGGFRGDIRFSTSDDGTSWTPATTSSTPEITSSRVTSMVSNGDRVLAAGSVTLAADAPSLSRDYPALWFSNDRGSTWRFAGEPGKGPLADRGSVNKVAAFRGGFIAVGSRKIGPDYGPDSSDAARSWTSADGQVWATDEALKSCEPRTPLTSRFAAIQLLMDVATSESTAVSIDSCGQAFLRESIASEWRAMDVDPSKPRKDLRHVVAFGDQLLVFGSVGANAEQPTSLVWASADKGRTWTATPFGQSAATIGMEARDFMVWHGRLYALGQVEDNADPQYCYQDFATCQQTRSVVFVTTDGTDWQRTTLAGDAVSYNVSKPYGDLWAIVPGGRPTVIGWTAANAPTMSRLDGEGPPVTMPPSTPPTTTPAHRFLPTDAKDLRVGEVWRYQYLVTSFSIGGCGRGEVDFNGKHWKPIETKVQPPYPPEWSVVEQEGTDTSSTSVFGTIELASQDRIEIGVEGYGPVWILAPAEDTSNQPGSCS